MGYRALRYYAEHVHFFCRPERDGKSLSEFAEFWKSYTSRKINAVGWPRPAVRAATSHDAESQPGHFFSDVDVFAFTASSTSLRTPSGVRSFGPISRLSTKSVGAVLTPTDLARA